MKRMIVFALALFMLLSLAACGEKGAEKDESRQASGKSESTRAAGKETKKDDSDSTTAVDPFVPETKEAGYQEEVIPVTPQVVTNFTGGVLIDDENGNHFEITSMSMTDEGYAIQYKMAAGGVTGTNSFLVTDLTINGVKYKHTIDGKSEGTLVIEKAWLDALGMTEVKSIFFELNMHLSGGSNGVDDFFLIYTGDEYTDPYVPDLSKGGRILYENDLFSLILMDANYVSHKRTDRSGRDMSYLDQTLYILCLWKVDIIKSHLSEDPIRFDDYFLQNQENVFLPKGAYDMNWFGYQLQYYGNAECIRFKTTPRNVDLTQAVIGITYAASVEVSDTDPRGYTLTYKEDSFTADLITGFPYEEVEDK